MGHDVIGVAERPDLRAMADDAVFAWAAGQDRWLLTENVKDFRPILLRALQAGSPIVGLLFTTSRAFPRSRKNPGPLIEALHAWLLARPNPRLPKTGSSIPIRRRRARPEPPPCNSRSVAMWTTDSGSTSRRSLMHRRYSPKRYWSTSMHAPTLASNRIRGLAIANPREPVS